MSGLERRSLSDDGGPSAVTSSAASEDSVSFHIHLVFAYHFSMHVSLASSHSSLLSALALTVSSLSAFGYSLASSLPPSLSPLNRT